MSLAMKISCLAILFVSLLAFILLMHWSLDNYGRWGLIFVAVGIPLLLWQLVERSTK